MEDFILLPTNEFPKVGQLNIAPYNTKPLEVIHYVMTGAGLQPQNLYQIQRNTPIKKGEHYLGYTKPHGKEVWNLYKREEGKHNGWHQGVKLIASTDPSLNLPPIPEETIQAFIQWYNSK